MAKTLTLKNLPDAEIRALRESLGPRIFDPAEIDALKREGRP
jgi:hypothetical protein